MVMSIRRFPKKHTLSKTFDTRYKNTVKVITMGYYDKIYFNVKKVCHTEIVLITLLN